MERGKDCVERNRSERAKVANVAEWKPPASPESEYQMVICCRIYVMDHLLPLVDGLALLGEGREPLRAVPGGNDRLVRRGLQLQPGGEVGLAPLVDGQLCLLKGDGAGRKHLGRQLPDRLHQAA